MKARNRSPATCNIATGWSTPADFETITRRTPGVDIGRVDVLPAFNPELGGNEPGDAPGAVTLMIIPKYDPLNPTRPCPTGFSSIRSVTYIDSRRLVTTEVFLRGPIYKQIWISVGITWLPATALPKCARQSSGHCCSSFPRCRARQTGALDLQVASSIAPQDAETHGGGRCASQWWGLN